MRFQYSRGGQSQQIAQIHGTVRAAHKLVQSANIHSDLVLVHNRAAVEHLRDGRVGAALSAESSLQVDTASR